MADDGEEKVTLEELFEDPAVSQYVRFFVDAGFEDADFILSIPIDSAEWKEMIQAVEAKAKKAKVDIKVGHKLRIRRIVQEYKKSKNIIDPPPDPPKRIPAPVDSTRIDPIDAAVDPSSQQPLVPKPAPEEKKPAEPSTPVKPKEPSNPLPSPKPAAKPSPRPDPSAEVRSSVMAVNISLLCEGVRCLNVHWACCCITSIATLVLGLILLFMFNGMATDDAIRREELAGGWRFVHASMIVAFIVASLTFCATLFSYLRKPEATECLPEIGECPDLDSCACACAGGGALCADTCGDVCPTCECGGSNDGGLIPAIRECFRDHCSSCPSACPACGDVCSMCDGACECQNSSSDWSCSDICIPIKEFFHCGSCAPECRELLPDCPTCDISLPSCPACDCKMPTRDDFNGCLERAKKAFCCKCKIVLDE